MTPSFRSCAAMRFILRVTSASFAFQTTSPTLTSRRSSVLWSGPPKTSFKVPGPAASQAWRPPRGSSSSGLPWSKRIRSPAFSKGASDSARTSTWRARAWTSSTRPTRTPRCPGYNPCTSFWWSDPSKKPCEKPREKLYRSSSSSRAESGGGRRSIAASSARRYLSTALATYSGPFIRPSILKQDTPASRSWGSRSHAARSVGESRYLRRSSARAVCTRPSTIKSYGIRQLWAHWPRLALRCWSASLVRHWPLQLTQSAPWTKHSSSRSVAAAKARISSIDSSRGRTTRRIPSHFAICAASGEEMVICVEACSGSAGHTSCARRAIPRSCTRMASAPARAISASASSATPSSRSKTRVLKVTKPCTPLPWRKSKIRGRSAAAKLSARARALNPPRRPKYTASAPAATAALRLSSSPAGASSSGFGSILGHAVGGFVTGGVSWIRRNFKPASGLAHRALPARHTSCDIQEGENRHSLQGMVMVFRGRRRAQGWVDDVGSRRRREHGATHLRRLPQGRRVHRPGVGDPGVRAPAWPSRIR